MKKVVNKIKRGLIIDMSPMEIGLLIVSFVFVVLGIEKLASTGSLFAKQILMLSVGALIFFMMSFLIGYQVKKLLKR